MPAFLLRFLGGVPGRHPFRSKMDSKFSVEEKSLSTHLGVVISSLLSKLNRSELARCSLLLSSSKQSWPAKVSLMSQESGVCPVFQCESRLLLPLRVR